MSHHGQQSGFTLIELSIVLVIIGILVGSILVGADMIESSRQRTLLKDIESISTAVNTFKLKYGCLPGDCSIPDAQAAGLSNYCEPWTDVYPGDGYIDLGGNEGGDACEHTMFAYHLYSTQLLSLPFDMTANALGGAVSAPPGYIISKAYPRAWIVPMSWMRLGIADGNWLAVQGGIWNDGEAMDGNTQHTTVLSPNVAHRLDSKVDDGNPLKGTVQILGYAGSHNDSTCEIAHPGYSGSCLGYGNQSGPENGNCATSNTPSTAAYVNNNNYGTDLTNVVICCKLAFRGF